MDSSNTNFLSRLLPPASGTQSIYETIKLHEESNHADDDVFDATDNVDAQNIRERFRDEDLDQLLNQETGSHITTGSVATVESTRQHEPYTDSPLSLIDRAEMPKNARETDGMARADRGGDVPDSLLMEDKASTRASRVQRPGNETGPRLPSPVPGPRDKRTRVRWDSEGLQRRQYGDTHSMGQSVVPESFQGPTSTDPAERAMWMWANVENLDNFLADVYAYFRGKGIWSILLSRCFEQLTLAFVVGFGTFLSSCIDYKRLPTSHTLPEITIKNCTRNMSGWSNLFVWLISFFWVFKSFRIALSTRRLWSLHCFFKHLLHVSEDELQTITWQNIVERLMRLRELNARTALNVNQQNRRFIGENSKQRMDAHDIANRLMRRENYLIALFNKDILDLTIPIPLLGRRQLFSQNLEWNINLCVVDYVFNHEGQVSQLFLKDSHRQELIEGLQRRFKIAGFFNVICAPFLVTYFCMLFFLRYFTEFQKNPSQVGSRTFTPLAEWKFREFNELYHFFERRLNMSRPFATRYLDQFPKDKVTQLARFVAFVAGALAAVLGVASLLDPEIFFGFEITHDKTVLFYLGIFGTVWAVARGMVPEDEDVFDPEFAINNVAEFTHYKPKRWDGRLHTEEVRKEFSSLYQMKIIVFIEEILSIIFTPFILWYSLPPCSERLVDFFREFTVHVDGLGYVCSFALFEFQQNRALNASIRPDATPSDGDNLRHDYFATKDGKMLASYYSFLDSYANKTRGTSGRYPDRRAFRPPPSFPGLSASPANAKGSPPRPRDKGKERAGYDVQAGPEASLLLDPLHQPPDDDDLMAELENDTRGLKKPPIERYRDEEEDGSTSQTRRRGRVRNSTLVDEDSNLGDDSWKTTLGTVSGDASRAQDRTRADAGNDNGVLGMLYEFQRAQTEGRGVDVKI